MFLDEIIGRDLFWSLFYGTLLFVSVPLLMWLFWNKPITSLRTRIGLDGLPRPLIAFLALLYVVIFLTVLLGLFAVIWQTVSWSVNDTREAAANKTLAQEFLFLFCGSRASRPSLARLSPCQLP